ncbi:tetratricopeptide repeat protein [Sphingomonas sp. FW199]|uniref:tetratricopeptide repeat protein n=1 Tax=Sphingomonas sp. FW199 TaxID=3400217 RepID=UPI003CF49FB2
MASDVTISAYARARAADARGDVPTAVSGYAAALAQLPQDEQIAVRAYREAIASGDTKLALASIDAMTRAKGQPADAALIVLADHLARGDKAAAASTLASLKSTPLDFMAPVIAAWIQYDTDPGAALAAMSVPPPAAIARRYATESAALMEIDQGQPEKGMQKLLALGQTGRSAMDSRIAAVDLLAGSRPDLATLLLTGNDPVLVAYRSRHAAPRKLDARFGISRLFTRLGGELSMGGTEPLAMVLARAALILDPAHSRAQLILADNLAREGTPDLALAQLGRIEPDSPFAAAVPGARIAILQAAGRIDEALVDARKVAARAGADGNDYQVLGDLLSASGDELGAAAAYGEARKRGAGPEWALALQQGGALERGGRWREALSLLKRAVELAPDEPLALNYLGYAQIERGENVKAARKLLERAVMLSPDNASIVDSLGWAYYRGGEPERALPLLEKAARAEPADTTIQEHLGDAYWQLGRRYEARYAWRAAAVYADTDEAARLSTKIEAGLKGN